jgi:hypothetical protein
MRMESQAFDILAMVHLIMLSLWGGVVATEAVIEIYPFRKRDLHAATIRFHYWIDLLVELPLVLAVIATGATLFFLSDVVTPVLLLKIGLGGAAVAINLFCIVVVVKRGRQLESQTGEEGLWRASRTVLACFATGLLCAAGAATLGFRFAIERMG